MTPIRTLTLMLVALWLAACGSAEYRVGAQCDDCDEEMIPFEQVVETPTLEPPLVHEWEVGIVPDPCVDSPDDCEGVWHFTDIDTIVTSAPIPAGDDVHVTCLGLDVNGYWRIISGYETEVYTWPASSFVPSEYPQHIRPIVAGTGEVACVVDELSLIDETAAEITITPGPPRTAYTTIPQVSLVAGEPAGITCLYEDEFGNPTTVDEPILHISPEDGRTVIEGTEVMFETAGEYDINCDAPGVERSFGQRVEVRPGLPAALTITRVPYQTFYGHGQVITIATVVTDIFGNVIRSAPVTITSDPDGTAFGDGRFTYYEDGVYEILAVVEGETEGGVELSATETIVINGGGPSVRCDNPADAGWIDASPGDVVTIEGTANDENGISVVWVNGTEAAVDVDGHFSAPHTVRYGINFVELEAEDEFGSNNTTTCAFLAADRWASTDALVSDTLMLLVNQSGIDDRTRNADINSINDLLYTMLNSSGIRDQIHASLSRNPRLYETCYLDTWFGCAAEIGVYYRNFRIGGPNESSLTLVTDGLNARVTIRGLGAQIHIDVDLLPDTTGWINIDQVTLDLTLDIRNTDGRARIGIRSVNSANIGNVSLDFSGIIGWIIDIVNGLFNGVISNAIRGAIQDYVGDGLDEVLDGTLGNIEVSGFDDVSEIERLDGSGTIPLSFAVSIDTVSATAARLLFGLGTRFSAPAGRPITVPEVPLLPADPRHEPVTDRSIGVSVYTGLLNQVLYALWSAGYFETTAGGGEDGATTHIHAELPIVTEGLGDGRIAITLGAFYLSVTYPGLFAEPLDVVLGARLEATMSTDGVEVNFTDIGITELVFNTPTANVTGTNREILEDFLRDVLQNIIADSLASALPTLPMPAFAIPSSLGVYGLPVGRELGIVSPTVDITESHILLNGNMGLR